MLAVRLPGAEEQVMPVAMQTLQIGFSHPGNTSQLVTVQDLVTIDRVSLLPVDDLVLPIPLVTPKSPRRLYLAFETKNLATSINAPKIVDKTSNSADYKIPVGVSVTTTKVNVIGAVRTSFNTLVDQLPGDPLFTLPAPPVGTKVEITVPDFEVDDEIGIDTSASYPISTPSVQIPRLSTDPIRGATALLEVPTDFDVEFEDQSLGTVLDNLAFTASLGWQGSDLGIVVKRGNTKRFTPFKAMFGS
jgi:hypothetical protein